MKRFKVFVVVSLAIAGMAILGADPASAYAPFYVKYQDMQTGRCLDSNWNGAVYTLGCNSGSYQVWDSWAWAGNNPVVNKATGRCLDSNWNGAVYTLPCNGGDHQKWTETWYSGGTTLRNKATGRCLDSNGQGGVWTTGCDGSNNQVWRRWQV